MKSCPIFSTGKLIRTLSLLLLFFLFNTAKPQVNIDSLMRIANQSEKDTNYVNASLSLAWEFMYSNADSAELFVNRAIEAANSFKNRIFVVRGYNTKGVTFIVRGDYPEALAVINTGLAVMNVLLAKEPYNPIYIRRILALYTNKGNVKYYLGEYSKAIENYLKALNYSKKINFIAGQANCLSNIGASYKDLLEYNKALEYNYQSLALANKTGDNYWISQSLNNLGATYYSVPDYDSARHYFMLSMKQFEKDNSEFELIDSYVNMGSLFKHLGRYDSALIYFNKAIFISNKLSSMDGLINAHYMIGQLYDTLEQMQQSVAHLKKSLSLAEETGTNRFIMLGNEELSNVYYKMGDYKKAYLHYKAGSIMRDSIFSTDHDKRIAEMETKFQTKEKEEKIILLTKQNALEIAQSHNRQLLFGSIIITLLLLLIILYLTYRSYKNKQQAVRSMLKQKADKKVMDAIVETEYKERKRFAKTLHDAMGALLSTLKLYINEMGDASNSEKERDELLQQSNELLDDAIANARNLAHNIMPAAIKEQGIELALRSFCDKFHASGKIKINFSASGIKQRFEHIVELSVYYMITEMINNTLKHAHASTITISMILKDHKLYINYKDNGTGFDYDAFIKSDAKGMGLSNIANRIKIIGGTLTISSNKGEGFETIFKVPV